MLRKITFTQTLTNEQEKFMRANGDKKHDNKWFHIMPSLFTTDDWVTDESD